MKSLVRAAAAIVCGAAAHVETTALFGNVIRPLTHGLRPFPVYAFGDWLSTWSTWPGVVAGVAVAAVVSKQFGAEGSRRALMIPIGVSALVSMGALVILGQSFWAGIDVATASFVVPVVLALAALSPPAVAWSHLRAARSTEPTSVAITVCLLFGAPALWGTLEARTRELKPFKIELAAICELSEPGCESLTGSTDGSPGVNRSNSLEFTDENVDWVHYLVEEGRAGVELRLDDATAAALERRSAARLEQADALFVNGRLVSAPRYTNILRMRSVLLTLNEDSPRLYEELTGRAP